MREHFRGHSNDLQDAECRQGFGETESLRVPWLYRGIYTLVILEDHQIFTVKIHEEFSLGFDRRWNKEVWVKHSQGHLHDKASVL